MKNLRMRMMKMMRKMTWNKSFMPKKKIIQLLTGLMIFAISIMLYYHGFSLGALLVGMSIVLIFNSFREDYRQGYEAELK
jgi:hypothetical protein